jgi:hypothetical protein
VGNGIKIVDNGIKSTVLGVQDLVESKSANDVEKDAEKNFRDTVEKAGFKTETHRVTTPDGFVLKMFRIIDP